MVIAYGGGKPPLPKTFRIQSQVRPISARVNYLGLRLDRHLSTTPHINARLQTTRQRGYRLYHLLRSSNITLRLKTLIYTSVLRPSLLHGAPLRRYIYPGTLRRLQRYQNGILLQAVRGTRLQAQHPTRLHEELGIPTVKEYIRRRVTKFYDRIKHCMNPLFKEIQPGPYPCQWKHEPAAKRMLDILA